ncbi:YqgQ family protein [Metasolibacillus sp. FSL H7-0170]|uniref:YqgQ family protein n=1 Tax=Metasolibacillus TaxID=2703677 RepID=UPI00079429DC|nr:YqgQ family protein [Metasolibacillus fluoroglycofenilyticus]KYG92194.1 cytoplasmic protein [[Bacillus] sp. KCTC 13219]
MKSMIDIYELLKQYGTYIYTTDRLGDLMLMEDEIRELYKAGIIEPRDFQTALLLMRQEASRIQMEQKG